MQEQGGGGLKLCTGIADPCRKRGDGGLKLYETPPLSMQKVLITILRFFFLPLLYPCLSKLSYSHSTFLLSTLKNNSTPDMVTFGSCACKLRCRYCATKNRKWKQISVFLKINKMK